MFGAFIRIVSKALRGVSNFLRDRKGEMQRTEDEVYEWNRYTSDLCEEICLPREGVWKVVITKDGSINQTVGTGVPPGHPNCDCAMLNRRTGTFRWRGSISSTVTNISQLS